MFKDLHVEASKNILNTPRYELLLDRFNEGDKYSFVDNKGMEEEDLILEEDIVYNINELL